MSRGRGSRLLGLAVAAMMSASCEDASDVQLLEIEAFGAVFGQVLVDANGTGTIDAGDLPFEGATVELLPAGGGPAVREERTDSSGVFLMTDLPVGAYRVEVSGAALGDSLEATGEGSEIALGRNDSTRVDFTVSYPFLTLSEIREANAGRRVFTSGITLNPRQSFGDGLVHLSGADGFLRLTEVDRVSLDTGDSIRVLGRTASDGGEPILTEVTPFPLIRLAAIPVPRELGTAAAATASDGEDDAALVRVRDAEILDTLTVDGDFTTTVDDGSGPVSVVIRSFLQLNTGLIQPDSIVRMDQVTGLLVPTVDETGVQRWSLLPRGAGDVVLEVKQADVSVDVDVTPGDSTYVMGDSLDIVVVVANEGPLDATDVAVLDTIPDLVDFVEATATRGTYATDTHLWTIGELSAGAADTLRLRVTITTDSVALLANRAWKRTLAREVDPNLANDVDQVFFALVPPPAAAVQPARRR